MLNNFANYRVGKTYKLLVNGIEHNVEVLEKVPHKIRLKLVDGTVKWYTNEDLTSLRKNPTTKNLLVDIIQKNDAEVAVKSNGEKPVATLGIDVNKSNVKPPEKLPNNELVTSKINIAELLKGENFNDYKFVALAFKRDVRFLLNKYGGAKLEKDDTFGHILYVLKQTLLRLTTLPIK